MVRSLLVPLDGSTFGEHALPLAINLARQAGAELHLIHVHQVVPPATVAGVAVMDTIDLHLREDEQAYLADVTRRVTEGRQLKVKSRLLDGEVSPAIRDYANEVGSDLIVMSTHGRGALGRFWLGSVADELVHELNKPILLVRPKEGKADLKHDSVVKTIVVPLDGTALAEKVIESAVESAKLFQASLVLVRVIKPVIRPSYIPEGSTVLGLTHSVLEQIHTLQQQQQDEAKAYLEDIAKKLRASGIDVQTSVTIDEQPAVGIMLEAQARHADLIVMETHARKGLSRLFLGSVADKIVRGGVVPILLNHPEAVIHRNADR